MGCIECEDDNGLFERVGLWDTGCLVINGPCTFESEESWRVGEVDTQPKLEASSDAPLGHRNCLFERANLAHVPFWHAISQHCET